MKEIIEKFEHEINKYEKSIQAFYEFSRHSWCHTTESGYDMLNRQENILRWYNNEVKILKGLIPCNCSWIRKFFQSNEYKSYGGWSIHQCKKCKGYFTK